MKLTHTKVYGLPLDKIKLHLLTNNVSPDSLFVVLHKKYSNIPLNTKRSRNIYQFWMRAPLWEGQKVSLTGVLSDSRVGKAGVERRDAESE